MSIAKINNKIVAHNYGHGGSGWTLAPGSVNYVNSLLIQSKFAKDLQKDTPLTIIGAGAVGLFTAYDLLKKGFNNITVAAEEFHDLTSHNASGLLALSSMDNDKDTLKIVEQIGIDSYKFYYKIANKKHADFEYGAAIVPAYFENRDRSGLESYVGVVIKPAKDVILDFDNGTCRKMVAYDDSIFIDVAVMMQSVTSYLKKKVLFKTQKFTTFDQVDNEYIINCSGLGAKELNNDNSLISMQGHLIMLKEQEPQNLQQMISVRSSYCKNKHGQKIRRSFYISPKKLLGANHNDIGAIGGTFIENATKETPNIEEFSEIIKQAKSFYGI